MIQNPHKLEKAILAGQIRGAIKITEGILVERNKLEISTDYHPMIDALKCIGYQTVTDGGETSVILSK